LVLVSKGSLGEAILKYADNMDPKNKWMVWMKISKKNRLYKKKTLKTDFGCESYAFLKKHINNNQRDTWKVEIGPHGDAPPYITLYIKSLLQINYL
jgi:hypothetical protein